MVCLAKRRQPFQVAWYRSPARTCSGSIAQRDRHACIPDMAGSASIPNCATDLRLRRARHNIPTNSRPAQACRAPHHSSVLSLSCHFLLEVSSFPPHEGCQSGGLSPISQNFLTVQIAKNAWLFRLPNGGVPVRVVPDDVVAFVRPFGLSPQRSPSFYFADRQAPPARTVMNCRRSNCE